MKLKANFRGQNFLENKTVKRLKAPEFKQFNWKRRLERFFPKENESGFEDDIYQNYKNYLEKKLMDPNCEFSWFHKTLKMANKRLRSYNAFYLWLGLCLERPWKKRDFPLNWPGYISKKSSEKLECILRRLEENHGPKISFPFGYPGEKTFCLYKKRELEKMSIIGIFTQHYSDFISKLEYLIDSNKALRIIKNQGVIRKRDLAKRLKFKSDYCQLLLEGLKKEGRIKLKESSHNSIWIIYNGS